MPWFLILVGLILAFGLWPVIKGVLIATAFVFVAPIVVLVALCVFVGVVVILLGLYLNHQQKTELKEEKRRESQIEIQTPDGKKYYVDKP